MPSKYLHTFLSLCLSTLMPLSIWAYKPVTEKDSVKTDTLTINNVGLKKSKSGLDKEIKYSAEDSLDVDNTTKIIHLYGDAKVDYGTIKLEADYIWIDMEKNEIHAYGKRNSDGSYAEKASFTDKDQNFKSNEISYNFKTQKGRVLEVITQQDGSYIHGEVIKRVPENTVFVGGGKYTTCDAEHPHFHFATKKIKMIQNDKIVTGPLNLVIANVPTPLILPFGIFPNNPKRASGILIPGYGEDKSRGFYLTNGGFHWAINDRINYTVYGDIYSQGSWALRNTVNYKVRYKYSGSLAFNYTNSFNGDKDLLNYSVTKDYRVSWTHTQDVKANPNITFSANVNFGTSTAFQNSLAANNNINNVLNNNYNSAINLTSKLNKRFTLVTNLRHNQNIITHAMTVEAPTLRLQMNPWVVKKFNIQFSSDFGNTISGKDYNFFKNSDSLMIQNGIKNTFSFSYSGSFKPVKFLNFSFPSIGVVNYNYFKRNDKRYEYNGDTLIERVVDAFNTGTSINISGIGVNTQLFMTYRPVKKNARLRYIKHIIKPNMTWVQNVKPVEDIINKDRAFRTYEKAGEITRYSTMQNTTQQSYLYGGPSSSNSSRLVFSLDNSVDMKYRKKINDRDTNIKVRLIKSLSFSGSYDLAASKNNWSDINGVFTTDAFNNLININMNGTMSPYTLDAKGLKTNTVMFNENSRITTAAALATLRLGNLSKYTKKSAIKFPSDMNLTYALRYSKPLFTSTITQTIQLSGSLKITNKWSLTYSTGYDIQNKQITLTSLDLKRDLHCWELLFHWVPFGPLQSYSLIIQPKATMLKDMKYRKQNSWPNTH